MSAGGVSTRFNNFLIDGISDRGLLGNFSAGTGQGAKPISLEAIREYQLLISPFDVRYGDFAGGLVNAVTKTGTSVLHGTVFGFARNDQLARSTDFLQRSPYDREQYGLSLGGPLAGNAMHFFVALESQKLTLPAKGPYWGAPGIVLPVREQELNDFMRLLAASGLPAGSPGRVETGDPLTNVFAKVDWNVQRMNTRAVVWYNYASADNSTFTRESSSSFFTRGAVTFPLSTLKLTQSATKSVAATAVTTNFGADALNEFLFAIKKQPNEAVPAIRSPLISVAVPRSDGSGRAYLESGSAEAGHGVATDQSSIELADNFSLARRSGTFSIGGRVETLSIRGRGQPGSYGSWLFSSLDSLSRGEAEQFRIGKRGGAGPPSLGNQYGIYVGEKFRLGESAALLLGLRADMLHLDGRPGYNSVVDSIYGRNTALPIAGGIQWSPRIGFEWSSGGAIISRFRGGIGVFSGRPPLGWLGQRFANNGTGAGTLLCVGRRTADPGGPPAFVSDYRNQPHTCAAGFDATAGIGGAVNLVDPHLGLARTLRTNISFERSAGRNVVATIEGRYTKNITDFVFANLNLSDLALPAGTEARDRRGRVMYGIIDQSSRARPRAVSSLFSEVIELQNQSRSYSYQLVARAERRVTSGFGWSAAYAFSRVRDVQTPPSQFAANENWQSGRVVAGRHDDLTPTVSALEIPHRVVLSAGYSIGGKRYSTDFSVYFIGESGAPFTYLASLGAGRGDLNADGTNLNDPIYVPLSAADTSEILFAGTSDEIAGQQASFAEFMNSHRCLFPQRGHIMKRNSCRTPWVNTTSAMIRQSLPFAGRTAAVQLDVFNVLNLLNSNWGKVKLLPSGANAPLLEHTGQTSGPVATSQSIFRFDPSLVRWSTDNVESAFQLQLGLRYSF
jgi:hypothetical protein